MKNYQQTVKQRRVKLDKLKQAFALKKAENKPVASKEFKALLRNKRWQVGCWTNIADGWDMSLSHRLGIYA